MNDKIFIKLIRLTKKALKKNEIAVAAVITKNNKIIASAYNKRQHSYDVTGHAEILAIRKAEKKLKDWRLDGCEMFVTLRPCKMCESVIRESRLDVCYYLIDRNYKNQNNAKVYYMQTKSNELLDLFHESFKKLRK